MHFNDDHEIVEEDANVSRLYRSNDSFNSGSDPLIFDTWGPLVCIFQDMIQYF